MNYVAYNNSQRKPCKGETQSPHRRNPGCGNGWAIAVKGRKSRNKTENIRDPIHLFTCSLRCAHFMDREWGASYHFRETYVQLRVSLGRTVKHIGNPNVCTEILGKNICD